ncbi:MAG TPA: hypothetical protein DEQ09_06485 [Bacteroidales bacterium]|nr:hypothetical protein [Bacteroidales bacterium]
MKKYYIIYLVLASAVLIFACTKKDETTERFKTLTGKVWTSDSLLVDGQDAGGPGGLLEKMAGDAEFRPDGTGYFGQYIGTWYFENNETEITINSDSLALPLTSKIIELNEQSFKITTTFPSATPGVNLAIRITFRPK